MHRDEEDIYSIFIFNQKLALNQRIDLDVNTVGSQAFVVSETYLYYTGVIDDEMLVIRRLKIK